jgi:hypothetical protein
VARCLRLGNPVRVQYGVIELSTDNVARVMCSSQRLWGVRTARVIISRGNRNPANAEGATDGATQRAALINQA